MPLVSKSFSIDIVPGKTPPTIHVSEKDIGRLYYISIVDDGTPFSIPSGTTAKVEGTIGPYGFSENADVINDSIIFVLKRNMTAIRGKVWTKIKLSNNGDTVSTCAFWLDVDKAGAVEGQYIDPDVTPDPGGGGISLEGFVQYNVVQYLTDAEKARARQNIGITAVLPVATSSDNGKVLGIVNGQWAIKEDETGGGEVPVRELPDVTSADNGKVLGVVNGQWAVKEDEVGESGDSLPDVTSTDNGKVLGVVNGQWAVKEDVGDNNIQSDWNQIDSSADDYIKNKPTIPTKTSDLANDSGFLTSADISGKVSKSGDSMSGNLQMATNKITGLGTPTNDYDAVNKKYVDDLIISGASVLSPIISKSGNTWSLTTSGTGGVTWQELFDNMDSEIMLIASDGTNVEHLWKNSVIFPASSSIASVDMYFSSQRYNGRSAEGRAFKITARSDGSAGTITEITPSDIPASSSGSTAYEIPITASSTEWSTAKKGDEVYANADNCILVVNGTRLATLSSEKYTENGSQYVRIVGIEYDSLNTLDYGFYAYEVVAENHYTATPIVSREHYDSSFFIRHKIFFYNESTNAVTKAEGGAAKGSDIDDALTAGSCSVYIIGALSQNGDLTYYFYEPITDASPGSSVGSVQFSRTTGTGVEILTIPANSSTATKTVVSFGGGGSGGTDQFVYFFGAYVSDTTVRFVNNNMVQTTGQDIKDEIAQNENGCKLLVSERNNSSHLFAYDLDEYTTSGEIVFYRIADGYRHTITIPMNSNIGTVASVDISNAVIPTKTSDLINDSGFITASDIPTQNGAVLYNSAQNLTDAQKQQARANIGAFPLLVSLSYNSQTDTWSCDKDASWLRSNGVNSMLYYNGNRYYVTSMFNTGGGSATIYYERQEIGSPDGIEEFKFEIQNDAVTIYRYTSPLNLFEIPIVYSNNAWDIDGTKIIAGTIYDQYKHCVLVTENKRIHIVKSFRSEDPQDKYVELIGVEPASDGSDLTIWKLIAEANSSQHASITTYTFSGGSFDGNVFYYLDGTNIKNAKTNLAVTGQDIYDQTVAQGLAPVLYESNTGYFETVQYHFYRYGSFGMYFRRLDGAFEISIHWTNQTFAKTEGGYNTPFKISAVWNSSRNKYILNALVNGSWVTASFNDIYNHAEGLLLNTNLPVDKIYRSPSSWISAYFYDIQPTSSGFSIIEWNIEADSSNTITVTRTIVQNIQRTAYYAVTLNADGTVNTKDSSLSWSTVSGRMSNPAFADYLLVTWGNSLFTAKAIEKLSNDDIKFIGNVEHDGIQQYMVFTLDGDNILTTTVIETYSRRPVVVWEVQDATQGLSALNTNISSSLAWQLTNLDLTPFKRIKIYSRAGRKTGAIAADSSITPASIIEMSLDDRAKETVSQNVFIGSSVVQNPNDANRLGLLTCAVSADKTKFAVVRATTLYGTAATSNTDAHPNVFMIEGYYD